MVHSYIAGAAKVLEDAVRNEIGCKVRSIELNLMQRCAAHLASATDIQESRMLGKTACQYALEGATGMMAAVIRTSDSLMLQNSRHFQYAILPMRSRVYLRIILMMREMM